MGLNAQSYSATQMVENYFEEAKLGNNYYISASNLKTLKKTEIRRLAIPELESETTIVRIKALALIKRHSLLSDDLKWRQECVSNILKLCKDIDSGAAGSAISSLKLYEKSDFSENTIKTANEILTTSSIFHLNDFIRLSGFVGNQNTKAILLNYVSSDSSLTMKRKWNLKLALARLGDEDSFNYCYTKVKTMRMNDKVVDNMYADLAYTRNNIALTYLLQNILSNNKNCISRTPDFEEDVICAYKIMELVAPCISNFPIAIDKYGDLLTEDIKEALAIVRDWINTESQLNINTNKY